MAPVFPADVQQLLVIKEEDPYEWSSNLDHPDLEIPHIDEEQKELWDGQEGEQLHRLEEDITGFPFTAVHVKSEDDEEKPQSLQLHLGQSKKNRGTETAAGSSAEQMKTELYEGCAPPESTRGPHPKSLLLPNTARGASDSSETELSYDDDDDWQEPLSDCGPENEDSDNEWKEGRTPESGAHLTQMQDIVALDCNTGKKYFSCSECGKQFLYEQSLQKHVTCHSKQISLSGLVNEESCKVKQNRESPEKVHAGEKRFGCDDCGKRFKQKKDLKIHMRVHTGERPFSCADCGKRFRYQGSLRVHMRLHGGEKPFVCDNCGKRFNLKTNLKRHMRVHAEEKPFGCDFCGQRFNHKTNLKMHIRLHTGEKPFGCDDCGQTFNQKVDLRRHMRVHTEEKPYGCDHCGKTFRLECNLKRHLTLHTGEKLFVCGVCGNRFNREGNLKIHMRVHTGEKPFGCDFCGKRFNQKIHLETHFRVHTGEKPFDCDFCGKRFRHQYNLKIHMRIHTE